MSQKLPPLPAFMIDGENCKHPEQAFSVRFLKGQIKFSFILSSAVGDLLKAMDYEDLHALFRSKSSFTTGMSKMRKNYILEPHQKTNCMIIESTFDSAGCETGDGITVYNQECKIQSYHYGKMDDGLKKYKMTRDPDNQISCAYRFLRLQGEPDKNLMDLGTLNNKLIEFQSEAFTKLSKQDDFCVLQKQVIGNDAYIRVVEPDDHHLKQHKSTPSTAPLRNALACVNLFQAVQKSCGKKPLDFDESCDLVRLMTNKNIYQARRPLVKTPKLLKRVPC